MKLFIISLFTAALLVQACKPAVNSAAITADSTQADTMLKHIAGSYKGDFDGSPIYITINFINGKQVAGYNVHKGLRRNLHGDVSMDGSNYVLHLAEPGDHPFDGKFVLTLMNNLQSGSGSWAPVNTPSLKEKKFQLARVDAKDYNKSNDADGMNSIANFFADDVRHSTLETKEDGSCQLKYYPQITDSTFEEQAVVVRGTWKVSNDKKYITVNWQPNERFNKKESQFTINYHKPETEDDGLYIESVTGEGFEFHGMP
ncbi:hypothetical protein [Chitinophaga vietnamensis]|uniref:hypothetical protein n=1 Tax=Chitinophaga vietnamensis TaxID=2593957 RepID=UPI001177D247|nr:hypothetical protein [Chitinophaga vietnamensis]